MSTKQNETTADFLFENFVITIRVALCIALGVGLLILFVWGGGLIAASLPKWFGFVIMGFSVLTILFGLVVLSRTKYKSIENNFMMLTFAGLIPLMFGIAVASPNLDSAPAQHAKIECLKA